MNLSPQASSPASFLRCLPILALLAAPFPACHANAAPPSILPTVSAPVVDIEVEDRSAQDKSAVHVAKLTLVLVDHHVKVAARDGDAKYELSAHMMSPASGPSGPAADPHVGINLQRGQADRAFDLSLESTIAAKPGRVVVAKVDRADGRTTTVTAQYH